MSVSEFGVRPNPIDFSREMRWRQVQQIEQDSELAAGETCGGDCETTGEPVAKSMRERAAIA